MPESFLPFQEAPDNAAPDEACWHPQRFEPAAGPDPLALFTADSPTPLTIPKARRRTRAASGRGSSTPSQRAMKARLAQLVCA